MKKQILLGFICGIFSFSIYAAEHRGRIQVQGSNPKVEKSESWDSSTPLTAREGVEKLDKLWNALNKAEQADRNEAYLCAKNFILNAKKNGGISTFTSKTCQNKNRKDPNARIDIEVIKGTAFK